MKKFNNEQGAALVLSLLIITLLLLFVLTLFYQTTNTSKQLSTIEKSDDARHIAEMGVDYYYRLILHLYDSEDKPIENIKSFVNDLPKTKEVFVEGNSRLFNIKQTAIQGLDTNEITIEFESKGQANGKEIIEKSEIKLILNGN